MAFLMKSNKRKFWTKTINPYGKSKLFIEEVLKDFANAYGLSSMIFRYFNAAGADPNGSLGEDHDPETHLIPLVLKGLLEENGFINILEMTTLQKMVLA